MVYTPTTSWPPADLIRARSDLTPNPTTQAADHNVDADYLTRIKNEVVNFEAWVVAALSGGGGPSGALLGSVANQITAPTSVDANGTATTNAALWIRSGRGSQAAPLALQSSDPLGRVGFGAQYDSTVGHVHNDLVALRANAAQVHTATHGGSYASLWTTPVDSITPAEVQRWNADGTSRFFGAVTADGAFRASNGLDTTPGVGALDHWQYNAKPPITVLAAAIASTGATTITITSRITTQNPFAADGPYLIKIDDEQMLVTAGNGTTSWTVERGVNGTTAATHANGATVTGQAIRHVMFIGDSITHGGGASGNHQYDSFPERVRRLIAQPSLGYGFQSLYVLDEGDSGETGTNGGWDTTALASWTKVTAGAAQDLFPNQETYSRTGATTPLIYSKRPWMDLSGAIQVDILWLDGPTAATFSYSIDGGATKTDVVPANPASWKIKRTPVVIRDAWVDFRIYAATAAGVAGLTYQGGIDLWSIPTSFATAGVKVHNLGYRGKTLGLFDRANASGDNFRLIRGDAGSIYPDLVVLEYSNDVDLGPDAGDVAAWSVHLAALRAALSSSCDLLIVNPMEQDRVTFGTGGTIAQQAAYRAASKTFANANNVAIIDIYDAWKHAYGYTGWAAASAAGMMSAGTPGLLHPSQKGTNDMAARVGKILAANGGSSQIREKPRPPLYLDRTVNLVQGLGGIIRTRYEGSSPWFFQLQRDSGTAFTSGQVAANVDWSASTDTIGTIRNLARISGTADGTASPTDHPGKLEFLTVPHSSLSPVLALTIDSAQNAQLVGTLTAAGLTASAAAFPLSAGLGGAGAFQLTRDGGAALVAGNVIWGLVFRGSTDGVGTVANSSNIRGVVDDNFAAGSAPGRLEFLTTPSAATTPAVRALIDKDGKLWIGATAGSALASIDQAGNATFASITAPGITGALTVDSNPVTATGASVAGIIRLDHTTSAASLIFQRLHSAAAVLAGDVLGMVDFSGLQTGTTYQSGAKVRGVADVDNWDATHRGGRLELLTAAVNSSVAVRALIDRDGTFYIGATSGASVASIDQSGNALLAGTLGVTGATTIGGALGVTGVTTLAGTTIVPAVGLGLALGVLKGTAAAAGWIFQRINGTLGSPAAIASGDTLAALYAQGQYDTTVGHLVSSAAILVKATQAYTSANYGSQILLQVSDNTASTLTTALTLDQDLSATFAGAVNANTTLLVGGLTTLAGILGTGDWSTSGLLTAASGATNPFAVTAAGNVSANAFTAKGSSGFPIALNNGGVVFAVASTGALSSVSSIKSSSATAGVGYAAGAGGTITQLTSKATGVTLDKATGQITMHNAALANGATATFTLTSSAIAATDIIIVNHISGGTTPAYNLTVDAVAAGSCNISVRNISGGSLSEAIVLGFAVLKAVTT